MAGLQGINTQTTALAGLNASGNGPSAITNAVKLGQTTSSSSAAIGSATSSSATSSSATSNSASIKDQASVSTTGGLVAQALTTSDVRQEKVSALQSAIASGSYNVPSSAVASKIVDSLLK